MKEIDFGEEGRAQIDCFLREHLNATDETCRALINSFEETGIIRFFAGGSLMYRHDEFNVSNRFKAVIPGYKKGMFSQDAFYRGTQDIPGLTLSIAKASEHDEARGAVMEICLKDGDDPLSECLAFLKTYVRRENPSGKPDSYDFATAKAVTEDGRELTVLICGSNPLTESFIGDKLPFEEKARILALTYGIDRYKGPGSRSNLQYLAATIDADLKMGLEPDEDMVSLFHEACNIRHTLEDDVRTTLESLENMGYLSVSCPLRGDAAILKPSPD